MTWLKKMVPTFRRSRSPKRSSKESAEQLDFAIDETPKPGGDSPAPYRSKFLNAKRQGDGERHDPKRPEITGERQGDQSHDLPDVPKLDNASTRDDLAKKTPTSRGSDAWISRKEASEETTERKVKKKKKRERARNFDDNPFQVQFPPPSVEMPFSPQNPPPSAEMPFSPQNPPPSTEMPFSPQNPPSKLQLPLPSKSSPSDLQPTRTDAANSPIPLLNPFATDTVPTVNAIPIDAAFDGDIPVVHGHLLETIDSRTTTGTITPGSIAPGGQKPTTGSITPGSIAATGGQKPAVQTEMEQHLAAMQQQMRQQLREHEQAMQQIAQQLEQNASTISSADRRTAPSVATSKPTKAVPSTLALSVYSPPKVVPDKRDMNMEAHLTPFKKSPWSAAVKPTTRLTFLQRMEEMEVKHSRQRDSMQMWQEEYDLVYKKQEVQMQQLMRAVHGLSRILEDALDRRPVRKIKLASIGHRLRQARERLQDGTLAAEHEAEELLLDAQSLVTALQGRESVRSQDWSLSESDREQYAIAFSQAARGGIADASCVLHLIRRSGVNQGTLLDILAMCNLDQNIRFSEAEFITVMHMVDKIRSGYPLPSTLPPDVHKLRR